jgi:hypothetical protein
MWKAGTAALVLGAWLVILGSGCDDRFTFTGNKTQVDTFTQDGDDLSDFFTQAGSSQVDLFPQTGFHQVDAFSQKASARVDILWVVDNSASMQQEQLNLGANFDSFIGFIEGSLIDYHIAVISTDMDAPTHSGRLQGNPKVITPATPNPQAAFAANVLVGTSGGGNEMGLRAAHAALSEPLVSGDNAGFLRADASLAIIFVSDEDDHSYGSLEFYSRFFGTLKGIGNERNVILSAIVGDAPSGCSGADGQAAYGERYHLLVQTWGEATASICSNHFSQDLEQLGLTVAGLSRKFELSREPDPDTVVVRVDAHDGQGFQLIDQDPSTGWRLQLDVKTIFFDGDYVPPPEADIEVEYGNVEKVFRLSARGDPTTLEVRVDEDGDGPGDFVIKAEGVDWVYDPASNAVVFAYAYVPPLDSLVEVSYSDLNRAFALSNEVENPETLMVAIDLHDGNSFRPILRDDVNGWIYHAESNSILFQGQYVPPFGAELRVTYSNLRWLFPLSVVPEPGSLVVMLDPDGAGPAIESIVIEYDENTGTAGWLYYGPGEAAPYTNTISFEMTDWPPLGAVLTVSYSPGSGS